MDEPTFGGHVNVDEILRRAYQAVEDAGIPTELRELAFGRAVDLIAGDSPTLGQNGGETVDRSGRDQPPSAGADDAQGSDRLAKIGKVLGLAPEVIANVYVEHEDQLQIVLDVDSLGKNTKARAMSLSLLLAAGRQYGGWDRGSTTYNVLKAEVERHHVYDSGNYAGHVKGQKVWFNVNGTGANATFGLKPGAKAATKSLIEDHAS